MTVLEHWMSQFDAVAAPGLEPGWNGTRLNWQPTGESYRGLAVDSGVLLLGRHRLKPGTVLRRQSDGQMYRMLAQRPLPPENVALVPEVTLMQAEVIVT